MRTTKRCISIIISISSVSTLALENTNAFVSEAVLLTFACL